MAVDAMRDLSRGVIRKVSPFLQPKNAAYHAENFLFDNPIGSASLRLGTTLINAQIVAANNRILGMHNFRDAGAGVSHALLAAVNEPAGGSSIYNVETGTAAITGLTAGLTFRFETYLDTCVFQNGTDAPRASTAPGTFGSWVAGGTALDVGNMPIGIDILNYKDRLHVLTAAGLLRRSSGPVSPGFTTISWTSGNDTIVIDPDQTSYSGQSVGLAKISGLLLIFKERAMYSYNGKATQADPITRIGCTSRQSISVGENTCFFFNPDGIWVTKGGDPQRISDAVQPYIDNMDTANYSRVSGFANGQHYYCSIGDVTIDGETFSNVVLRYSIHSQEWAVYTYPFEITAFSQFINGTAVEIAAGDDTARIYRLNVGATDNGTAISFRLDTHQLEFGSRSTVKSVSKQVNVFSENPPPLVLRVREDRKGFRPIGSATEEQAEVSINDPIRGNYFRFGIAGTAIHSGFIFHGFEWPIVQALTIDKG